MRNVTLFAASVAWLLSAPIAFAQALERDVTFQNGDAQLQGTLMLPSATGRFPAVIFLHGSGPATRAGARDYAVEFAKIGIASLFFDKRGSGKSSGDWMSASLHDLAGDAIAAVQVLRKEPSIDQTRIGFWGVSQAGWVATLAASQSSHVAFMVLISGGGATPKESEMFSYFGDFDRAGLTPAERAEAGSVLETYFEFLATGSGREALVKRLENSKSAKWYSLAPLDRILPSEKNQRNWSWVATWDPAPHIRRLKIPMLLMFGDRDTDHPTEIAVRKWREGLTAAGNSKVTIKTFPGAGHAIRVDGYTGKGRAPFADGYAETMLGWLTENVANANK